MLFSTAPECRSHHSLKTTALLAPLHNVSFHHGANLDSPGTAGDTDDDGKNKVHTYFNRPQAPSLNPQTRPLSQWGRRHNPQVNKTEEEKEKVILPARRKTKQLMLSAAKCYLLLTKQSRGPGLSTTETPCQTPNQCHLGEIIRLNGRLANAEPES